MANVLVNDTSLADIADAIREKNGTAETYKPAEMGAAIREIESGGGTGIILSDFTGAYNLPKVADLRGIPEVAEENFVYTTNKFANMFANNNATASNGFYTALETVYLPKIYAFSTGIFNYCSNLKNIIGDFSKCERIELNAFQGCAKIETAPNMPNLTLINNNAFKGTGLKVLKLTRQDTIVTLGNISAFQSTPIASGTGFIYVPKALIETYKTATNWVTYANQFRALEDYTVDGTITGELDESKIQEGRI